MSAIEDIIMKKIAPEGGDEDGLFDPLAKVPAKGAAKKGKSKKTGAAVAKAMAALEPDEEITEEEAEEPVKVSDSFDPSRLESVVRPSGMSYNPRVFSNTHTDLEMLLACREQGISILLAGYPGCGKTAVVEAAFGEDVITVEGTGDTEVADFVGTYIPDVSASGEVAYRWQDGPMVMAMKEGKVLFVDDCTLIDARVLAKLYPAMDGRGEIRLTQHEGEIISAAPGFYVIGAHNPGAPGAILSDALASRFAIHMEIESDLTMAFRMGISRKVVRAARALRTQRKKGVVTWAPEMRELLNFRRVSKLLGDEVAANNMVAAAPEEAREDVIKTLSRFYPDVQMLRLAEDDD